MKIHGAAVMAVIWCGAMAAAGCCCTSNYCNPCGPHDIVEAASCEPACAPCGDSCGPVAHHACGGCIDCGVNGPCPKHVGSRGLLGYLHDSVTCGAGCGEFYVHPWINDPPDCADPCDCHGNWIGPQPCGCGSSACGSSVCGPSACGPGPCPVGWWNLWGHRSDIAPCHGGHAPCGPYAMHGGAEVVHGPMMEGTVIEGPAYHTPTPAAPPSSGEGEEVAPMDSAPMPPEFPSPARNVNPKTRSALKKIDGRPAVYYNRPYKTAAR